MICGDITEDTIFEKIKKTAIESKVNLIIATPPCQGMSCAGKKDPDDPRNFLIYYAIEMIKAVEPDLVILENVPMQMHTKIKYHNKKVLIPNYIESELASVYRFNTNRIVNCMDYGIPQSRQRCIYLLSKKNLGLDWEFPKKDEKIITLREAIGHLPSLDPCLREEERWRFPEYEEKRLGLSVSKWHYPPVHSWRQVEWMIHTPSDNQPLK